MLDVAGQDSTEAFEDVGHSDEAREVLEKLYVGELKRQVRNLVPNAQLRTTRKANKHPSGWRPWPQERSLWRQHCALDEVRRRPQSRPLRRSRCRWLPRLRRLPVPAAAGRRPDPAAGVKRITTTTFLAGIHMSQMFFQGDLSAGFGRRIGRQMQLGVWPWDRAN